MNENRTIYMGDNLEILRKMNSNSVDLIYLDPPFNSNINYSASFSSKADGAEFKDTWNIADIKVDWISSIKKENSVLGEMIGLISKIQDDSMMAYLLYMSVRLIEMKRLLKDTGSIWLHCDYHAAHYLKMVMDAIFGKNNFINEINWARSVSSKRTIHVPRTISKDVDVIFFYSKGKNYIFNPIFKQLSKEEMDKKFPLIDGDGRRYNTETPIFCNPAMKRSPNKCYTYKGVTNPHPSGWRMIKEKLIAMDERGEIIWRDGKKPLRKAFADKYPGKLIGSLWSDIPVAGGRERIGYPTQKPIALLKRIIEAGSNEGGFVLDPFCGSSSTCIAAEELDRRWCGIDISDDAVELGKNRFKDKFDLDIDVRRNV